MVLGWDGLCCCPVLWVAVKELKLSYHNPATMFFTIYPYIMVTYFKCLNSNPVFLGVRAPRPEVGAVGSSDEQRPGAEEIEKAWERLLAKIQPAVGVRAPQKGWNQE